MMMIKKEISIDITCAGILEREKSMPSSLSISSSIDCSRSDFVKRLYSVRKNDFYLNRSLNQMGPAYEQLL